MKSSTDKILIPIDGSESSNKGLRYGCRLANKLEATITVLNVVNIPYVGESPSVIFDISSLVKAGQMILERAKKIAQEENCKDISYELRQGIGNPGHEIVKFSQEGGVSLIVMCARGHTPLTHLLIGSVSDMVVHHAPCPVLIVR